MTLVVTAAVAQVTSGNPALTTRHLIDIGGRHLNLVCSGSGSPTVVFEYGLGGHLLNWQKVQEPVSALTTACFYDRAGYGDSDPSSRPMTAQNATDDLHVLLMSAGVAKPIVLVGHSLGGLYATLYTDRFPAEVAGLVLIDPVFAGDSEDETSGEVQRDGIRNQQFQAGNARCADLAGQHQLTEADPHGCFQLVPGRTKEEIAYLMDQLLKPDRYEGILSESRNLHAAGALSEDEREEQSAEQSFGDKPMIVLTAGLGSYDPADTPEEREKSAAHWKAGHDRLAARSARGESIMVPGAGHMIQLDRPQAVIDAIRKVVMDVRAMKQNR